MTKQANFCHEVGMLARIPRSGFAFLGTGRQTVAEHVFRAMNIAWLLNKMMGEPVEIAELLQVVMFHDLPEARTGDLNYENQKYAQVDEEKLFREMDNELPYGAEIVAFAREYEERQTLAARIAYDADQLEFLVTVKEELDRGNPLASDWIPPAEARLKSDAAKQLAREILETRSDEWWFHTKDDAHWVNRGREE